MGCFDSVFLNCPRCGHEEEVQSKAGALSGVNFEKYPLSHAPLEIVADIRNERIVCRECHAILKIRVAWLTSVEIAGDAMRQPRSRSERDLVEAVES
jgi:transcription elongation factor Elf1